MTAGKGETAMERTAWESAAEAILFALGEPVETGRLAQALDCTPAEAAQVCRGLAEGYETTGAGCVWSG